MSEARAQVAALLTGLDDNHVRLMSKVVKTIKMIQDNKQYADIILKFQHGQYCHGGGVNVKDGPCPFAGGFMVKD